MRERSVEWMNDSGRILVWRGKQTAELPNNIPRGRAKYTREYFSEGIKVMALHRQQYSLLSRMTTPPNVLSVCGPALVEHAVLLKEALGHFNNKPSLPITFCEISPEVIVDNDMIQQAVTSGTSLVWGDAFKIIKSSAGHSPKFNFYDLDLCCDPLQIMESLKILTQTCNYWPPHQLALHITACMRGKSGSSMVGAWDDMWYDLGKYFHEYGMSCRCALEETTKNSIPNSPYSGTPMKAMIKVYKNSFLNRR